MTALPINMGPQGPVPTPPATLRQQLVTRVSATNPDYTANLPGSLIEDIVSTDVGALVIANQFLIDLINSISPYAANAFILNQLGTDVYGIQPASATNTTVNVVFIGTPGFIIIPGFTITDGTYQYICTEGGIVGTAGQTLPLNAVASVVGTWAVPAGTVNGLITAVPQNVTLTVINPTDGIPSVGTETVTSFRTRTLTAGLAASTGMDRYLKTLLWNVPGVIQRLVSVRIDPVNNKYVILVGGGDPYQVAWAIYYAIFDLTSIEAPLIPIDNITNTVVSGNISAVTWLAGIVTVTATGIVDPVGTNLTATISGLVPAALDGTFTITVTATTSFTYPLVANPGTVTDPVGTWSNAITLITTSTNHNLITGMIETFANVGGMTILDNQSYPVTVTGPNTLTIPVDSSNIVTYFPFTTGGTLSPNPILQEIYLNSYPDTYLVPFILPAQEYVNIVCTWNTDFPNYVSPQAISQAAAPALVDYINSLYVGTTAINIFDMIQVFLNSTTNIVPSENVTVINFVVSFNGTSHLPAPGTGVIYGDPNSYFFTDITQVTVVQGGTV
jgi:hypothetical protein